MGNTTENQLKISPVPSQMGGGSRWGAGHLCLLLVLWMIWAGGTAAGAPGVPDSGGADAPAPKLTEGFVYYRDGSGPYLKAVARQFPSGLGAHPMGLALMETLMAGPPDQDLEAIFPPQTRVTALFITAPGDAYVDLALPGGRLERSDTLTELLGIYSLVNSLTLNIPEIIRVKLLVNGVENSSLGGHVSLAPFFKTNMLIVK